MYKFDNGQISLEDFGQPIGMNLKNSNRWVKRAQTIPWLEIEKKYAKLFSNKKGNVAKSLRLGLGARIIQAEYGYYGSTSIEPNADVKAAVSYIFDENGSAVQHRVLCFYIGSSAWHETQNFVVELDGVRFFDMYI